MTIPIGFSDCDSILTELQELAHWELSDQSITEWLAIYSVASAKLRDINMEFDLMRVKGINKDSKSEEEIQFYKDISPKFKELDILLTKKYIEEVNDLSRYPDLSKQFKIKSLTQDHRIIDLQLEEQELINQYYDLSGDIRIDYDGSKNLFQAAKIIAKSNSREEREKVYRLCIKAELDVSDAIDEVFVKLISLRHKKAKLLAMQNYIDFTWVYRTREYRPEQSIAWTKEIVQTFQPLYELTCQKIADMRSVNELAPWDSVPDISIDIQLAEKDYKTILINAFGSISKDFGNIIETLSQKDSFDIMASEKNSAQNFAYIFKSRKELGIHANATGSVSDFRNLMHECGHLVHEYYAFDNELVWQKRATGEVAELIAYIFQCLASDYLKSSGFLNKDLWSHYQLFIAKFILSVFWEDSGDEQLQQWIYKQDTTPSASEIDNKYLSVRSTPLKLDADLIQLQKKNWQTYHVVAEPFYSFDYSVALIGTLLCIDKMCNDKETFVFNLTEVMKQGSKIGITEALTTLGVNFPYKPNDIEHASEVLLREFLS